MDQQQSFNLNAEFFSGFTANFLKLVFTIIAVFVIILILNFLRDKFINKVSESKNDAITDLLTILNKVFFVSGFGFILGNIVQVLFAQMTSRNNMMGAMSFKGEWDYLTFGVIVIFIGLGFKMANKALRKVNNE